MKAIVESVPRDPGTASAPTSCDGRQSRCRARDRRSRRRELGAARRGHREGAPRRWRARPICKAARDGVWRSRATRWSHAGTPEGWKDFRTVEASPTARWSRSRGCRRTTRSRTRTTARPCCTCGEFKKKIRRRSSLAAARTRCRSGASYRPSGSTGPRAGPAPQRDRRAAARARAAETPTASRPPPRRPAAAASLTIVSRKPAQVCSVSAVPTCVASGCTRVTSAENCAESATTAKPQTTASTKKPRGGAP